MQNSRNLRIPSTGTVNNLVIYIRFNDQTEFEQPRSFFDQKFNDSSENATSMYSYYQEVSYQSLDINSSHYPESEMTTNLSYQDEHDRSYFCEYDPVNNPNGYQGYEERTQREHQLLVDAVEFIESEVPEDLIIDSDEDGYVDNVCFIIRGSNENWADLLWAHRWTLHTYSVYINDKRVYDYTFQPVTQNSVSTLCHEMFHSLGAPDLYHYQDAGFSSLGPWDIMDGGTGHMSAYMKYRYTDWIEEIPELSQSDTYEISPLTEPENNCYKVYTPASETEYFVIEYRKRVPNTYEMSLPGSGLIITRVNTDYDGQGNAQGPPDELYAFRINGSPETAGTVNQAYLSEESGRTQFNEFTNPYPFYNNGESASFNISNIGSSQDPTMSFLYTVEQVSMDGYVSTDQAGTDLTEIAISIEDLTFNPDENGYFSTDIYPGQYTITAYLENYGMYEENIDVVNNEPLTLDIELEYLVPPQNLIYALEDSHLELSWDFANSEDEDFENFAVYISLTGDNFSFFEESDANFIDFDITQGHIYYFYVKAEYSNGVSDQSNIVSVDYTSLNENNEEATPFELFSCYPNPVNFTSKNKKTTFAYSAPETKEILLEIYNIKGQLIKSFKDISAGKLNTINWNGKNKNNQNVSSGIYFYQLKTNSKLLKTKKLLILR